MQGDDVFRKTHQLVNTLETNLAFNCSFTRDGHTHTWKICTCADCPYSGRPEFEVGSMTSRSVMVNRAQEDETP